MREIIIAYPVRDTAHKLRTMFEREGMYVSHVCALGSSALSIAQELREGIIVCPEMLSDMSASNIAEHLPPGFDVVALSHAQSDSITSNLVYLPLPVNREELIDTLSMLSRSYCGFTQRSKDDSEIISRAKSIIMKCKNMTELQAHKYLQRQSMCNGKSLTALAKEIIDNCQIGE